ncbi:hypothetical protein KPB05_36505 [Burkholderia gladioli]|uniref:hypothetical protein n=1 Tax=Burkholderia gladioli TaxID=28095 RepID=UPI002862237D|nr:hypothetical protein [Burkholderia gladioli]MDR8092962.1 hypothetical protein [Burkholderia gladioli]
MKFLQSIFFPIGIALGTVVGGLVAYSVHHAPREKIQSAPDAADSMTENAKLDAQLVAQSASLPPTIQRAVCLPTQFKKPDAPTEPSYGYACTLYVAGSGQPIQWSAFPNLTDFSYMAIVDANLAGVAFDATQDQSKTSGIKVRVEVKEPQFVNVDQAALAIKTTLALIGTAPAANTSAALQAAKAAKDDKAYEEKIRANKASWSN